MTLHSFHMYWINPTRMDLPVYYAVERTRDGKSFAVRHVRAYQIIPGEAKHSTVVTLSASYHNGPAEHRKYSQPSFQIPPPVIDAALGTTDQQIKPGEPIPRVLPPEQSQDMHDLFHNVLTGPASGELSQLHRHEVRKWLGLMSGTTIEVRAAMHEMFGNGTGLLTPGSSQAWWFRNKNRLGDDVEEHKSLFAYCSE